MWKVDLEHGERYTEKTNDFIDSGDCEYANSRPVILTSTSPPVINKYCGICIIILTGLPV